MLQASEYKTLRAVPWHSCIQTCPRSRCFQTMVSSHTYCNAPPSGQNFAHNTTSVPDKRFSVIDLTCFSWQRIVYPFAQGRQLLGGRKKQVGAMPSQEKFQNPQIQIFGVTPWEASAVCETEIRTTRKNGTSCPTCIRCTTP